MKLIARYNVQVRGHIYTKGEAMEWGGPLTPRLIANFTAEDGSALAAPDGVQEQQGPKGPQGLQSDEQEQQGPKGPQGLQGDEQEQQGPKGPQGLQGDEQEAPQPPKDGELPLEPPPPEAVDEDALIKRTLDVLKREGVMRQLDEMGVTYQANAKGTFLARLLLMSKGEIKCSE